MLFGGPLFTLFAVKIPVVILIFTSLLWILHHCSCVHTVNRMQTSHSIIKVNAAQIKALYPTAVDALRKENVLSVKPNQEFKMTQFR
jgi:hypothetical protein